MHADFQPCAYIMASARHGTLYTGVTSLLNPARASGKNLRGATLAIVVAISL
ncbi:hypothetical protein [Sphingopyxis sp. LC363]|jgi:predicted GIY-YIG superfamily endonuclease|uniref:hypothetical protein n=1 Tax=Sphingopyxis sp. LC363 TaxID=1120705 RepID=UPI000A87E58E|nr:hypothetical protein [Sphingopyxis sp. LC363]